MTLKRISALLTALCMLIIAGWIEAEEKPANKVNGWSLSFNSFGPIQTGMKVSEAENLLRLVLKPDRVGYPDECYYVLNEKDLPGLSFMIVGGKIVRIDVSAEYYQTDIGARVGLTEAQIKKLYPNSEVSPDPYREAGHYISVTDKSKKYGMIFSTDGKVVRSFRAGQYSEVQWIEGCE